MTNYGFDTAATHLGLTQSGDETILQAQTELRDVSYATLTGGRGAAVSAGGVRLGGFYFISYGGRDVPSVLGDERVMDLSKEVGHAHTAMFTNATATFNMFAAQSTDAVNILQNLSTVSGIGWALAAEFPLASAAFGLTSVLSSAVSYALGPIPDGNQAFGLIQRDARVYTPEGQPLADDRFSPISQSQSGTGLSGTDSGLRVGSQVARQVVLFSEVYAISHSTAFSIAISDVQWSAENMSTFDVIAYTD